MNLAQALVDSAGRHRQRPAIRIGDIVHTYGDLDASSRRVAGLLLAEHRLTPGDRVAVMLPNVAHFASLYYGVLRAGGIVVPMNPLLKDREVAHYLGDSGARLIVVPAGADDEVTPAAQRLGVTVVPIDVADGNWPSAQPRDEIVERQPEDTAVILYTSGTTGSPKGAELTHANLADNVSICVETLLHITSEDVIFGGLPLFHAFGQTCTLNVAVRSAAALALLPRFDAATALDIMRRDEVTVFQGVPTMYSALLAVAADTDVELPALRVCVSGGSSMPVEVLRAFEERFGCAVLEGYGLSETSPAASFNHPGRPRVPGSVGTPVRGVQMRIADGSGGAAPPNVVGEIEISGSNVMKGYWNAPARTAEAITDGWFHTGDLGRIDDQGNYYVVDRKEDVILRGGYNVYPREIEEVLYEHADVAEAAVIGIAHRELGEEVSAVVALKPGATATAAVLREFVKSRVAAYKYPRIVRIVDALPKGPTGKILKREISEPIGPVDTT